MFPVNDIEVKKSMGGPLIRMVTVFKTTQFGYPDIQ